jgi:hypothetical protein
MAGLLDNKVGDVLKGAVSAAAFGANPALGLLFGGAIGNSRLKREAENKMIRDSMAARDQMADLFGRTSPGPAASWHSGADRPGHGGEGRDA